MNINVNGIFSDFYLNHILMGHDIFPKIEQKRFQISGLCVCSEAEGTVKNSIMRCKLWDNIRIEYFPLYWNNCSIYDLLCNNKSSLCVKLIVKFLFDLTFS